MIAGSSSLGERGQALLLLIVVISLLLPLGIGFVSSMNRQQRLAGDRYRATAALYLAEAGIQKALWYLEREAPDGSQDASWRPSGHAEALSTGDLRGRFVLDVTDDADGRVLVTSWGEVGRVRRGVRVVANVAPGALDYALFGAGLVAIDGDQAVLSLVEVRDHCRPEVMLASNTEIWFRTPGSRLEFTPCGENPPVLKIGLPDTMRLTVGDVHGATRFLGLQEFGVLTGPVDVKAIAPEGIPAIDVESLRRRAERNEANADLNRAAGEAADRSDLRDQRHSLYSPDLFALLLHHLRGSNAVLVGGVYVTGRTFIPADVPLTIVDGFLGAEGGLTVEAGGRLTVRHSNTARLIPGLVTVGKQAPLVLGEGARVVVDGVVVTEGLIDIREAASVQIEGAIIAAAPDSSLRLNNAALRIRYDPAVPGTVGLLARDGRRRVFPLAWHEVR